MVDEKEERLAAIRGAMKMAGHSRVNAPERNIIHFILFCMLRDLDFEEIDGKRQVSMFHNRTLNFFFDDVADLLLLIDSEGDYGPLIRNGMLTAKGKLFARPESLLSFFQGVPVPVTDINVRIDNHDKNIIGNFISCFEKHFGPSSEIGVRTSIRNITNYTLSRFLMNLWKMMILAHGKRHFRDSIHKDTLELKIHARFV